MAGSYGLKAGSRALVTTQEGSPGTRRFLCGIYAHIWLRFSCADNRPRPIRFIISP
jgi:hypothetical protein